MRIGIDVDGVLVDIERFQLNFGSKFYFEKYKKRIVDPNGYETFDIFDVSSKLDAKFWKKYFLYFEKNIKPREFASEILKKLKKKGYELYIITARGNF